jgi:hypothetical protein
MASEGECGGITSLFEFLPPGGGGDRGKGHHTLSLRAFALNSAPMLPGGEGTMGAFH